MEDIKEMLKTIINLAVNNSKECKNDKGDDEMEIQNEKVDKREIIREIMAIAAKDNDEFKGGEDEKIRTIAGLAEKLSYNESEAGKADNKKSCKVKNEDEEDKKVDNEDEDEEKKEKEEDKKRVNNSKVDYFAKMNEVYNALQKPKDENVYVSRDEKLKAAEEYFKR